MCNEEKDSLTIKPLDNFFQAMLSISILGIILFFICGVEKDIILLFLVCFIMMIWWGFLKTETMVPEEDGAFRGL